jgi:hypothetical protein
LVKVKVWLSYEEGRVKIAVFCVCFFDFGCMGYTL